MDNCSKQFRWRTIPMALLAVLTVAAVGWTPASAEVVKINSPSFDFVQRVNYGTSTVFVNDALNFSVYAKGDNNSAQQTWFAVSNAVASAAGGRKINSATLLFRNGTTDSTAKTVYLARTGLGVTAGVNRTTYNGSAAYPSTPGTTTSFGGSGYLVQPLAVSIDATGAGSVDVTAWVTNYPGQAWFLTASPAAAGTSVTSVSGANWSIGWHWQNALVVNGNTESPVQLVLDLAVATNAPPSISAQPPARAAGYAGEPLSIAVTASGGEPLFYQWQKDGTNVPGATSATLSFNPLAMTDAGNYQVVVSNAYGTLTSRTTDLNVIAHPDLANFVAPPGENTRYSAQGNAVIGRNQARYFNRPLYVNNTSAFVLTGDKPMAEFASGGNIHGKFLVGLTRGGTTKWLHNCADIEAGFQPAHTTWRITDPAFPGLVVRLEITTLTGNTGFAARSTVTGALAGDKLVWAYGGATAPGGTLNTTLDPYRRGEASLLSDSFSPSACANNSVQILTGAMAGAFSVLPSSGSTSYTLGRCSVGTNYLLTDASAWTTPASLVASTASTLPLTAGQIPLDTTPVATWSFFRLSVLPGAMPDYSEPNAAFASGLSRSADLSSRLMIESPDARLSAAAAMAVAGVDGTWYGQTFRHGAMSWNGAYLGWRTTIGGAMLGWHDRVKIAADYYLATQRTSSTYTNGNSVGGSYLLTKPASDSRFYGKGYVVQDQTFYEMQTQFFDQILQDWRWRLADDPVYEAKLRTALELHLERARECYDPDDDGTYESLINTWPTDSIWFNGGGCPDQTAYIYRAHGFARDLAARAGDSVNVAAHEAQMTKIKNALFAQLWVTNAGHPGLFREQGGNRRLVDNPWLYSLCLPIEAAMLTPEQAATTLFYSEYGLQNDAMSSGGRRVWTGNFSPSIWSARVLWPGDNYMLAYTYLQTGFARDGWEVLRGTFLHAGFNDLVPGDSANFFGGTDFGDCVHPFTRTLVEGLFGYQPDFPNGRVRLAPQMPETWTNAAMKTPDVQLRYTRTGNTTALNVRLQRAAVLDVELPVRASNVAGVTINGLAAPWQTTNGFGCTVIRVSTTASAGTNVVIAVTTSDSLAQSEPVAIEGITGSSVSLAVPGAALVSFSDPEGALQGAGISDGAITGTLSTNLGWHRVFARVNVGGLPQTRIFNLHTLDVPGKPATSFAAVPSGASWLPVNMTAQLVTNITTIYQQQYLSPRPLTISSRVGTDGYSPWTFPHWGLTKPTIAIGNVASLLSPTNASLLVTPQGVPFRWGGNNNVAFASLWDNWPDQVTVPVNQSAEAAWFLVCGSTTVMQSRIANAVLRLKYADGVEERLELIPPYNYWNLSPIYGLNNSDQFGAEDYTESTETYMVPKPWPMRVQLGSNCRAMVLNWKLRPGAVLQQVTLEALSQESVIGLMGVTLMNPAGVSGALNFRSLPQNQTVARGAQAAFTVSADGTGPLSYRWFKEGVTEAVALTQTLEFSNVGAGDFGMYQVVVSNFSGSITSPPVTLAEAPSYFATTATASASAIWSSSYGAALAVDGSLATRWACGPAGATSAWLQLDFPQAVSFNQVFISEAFDRTRNFNLQVWDGADWQLLGTGTTIGTNYTLNFPGVTSPKLRLNILNATDAPSLWEVQVNYAPTNAPAELSLERNGGQLRLNWQNGFLQQASSLLAAWNDVAGAVSPWSLSPVGAQAFFRARR